MLRRFLPNRRIVFTIVVVILLLLVAALVFAYFLLPGFGRRGHDIDVPYVLPGLVVDDRYDQDLLAPGIWQRISDRLVGPVPIQDGKPVYLPYAAYRVTATRKASDAERSTRLVAEDLLLYAQAVAEQGKRGDFLTFIDDFERVFLQGKNPVVSAVIEDGNILLGDQDYALWFAYEKALLLAWQRWPEARIEASIMRGAGVLKSIMDDGALGKPAALPTDVTYPWVSTDITPTPMPQKDDAGIVILGDIDLYVLQALQAFDPDFGPYFDAWRANLSESIADVGAPFPAYALWEDGSGYIFLQGDQFSIETKQVLTTLLSLAEIGDVKESSLNFFRQALLDGRGLSTRYRISDAASLGEAASADMYGVVARLGRAAGDEMLTDQALLALNRFYASSQTSIIFGGMFRMAPDDGFELLLSDNVRALLALR